MAQQIADDVEGRQRSTERCCARRLIHVAVVPDELRLPGGVRGQVMLVASAYDGSAVMTAQRGLRRAKRLPRTVISVDVDADVSAATRRKRSVVDLAAKLIWIEPILRKREAKREVRIEVVVDELERYAIARRHREAGEKIHRNGVELVIYRRLVGADVAHERRNLISVTPCTVDSEVVVITEAAEIRANLKPLDLASAPSVKVDCPSGRIVPVERRGGPLNDINAAVGMRIGQDVTRPPQR